MADMLLVVRGVLEATIEGELMALITKTMEEGVPDSATRTNEVTADLDRIADIAMKGSVVVVQGVISAEMERVEAMGDFLWNGLLPALVVEGGGGVGPVARNQAC